MIDIFSMCIKMIIKYALMNSTVCCFDINLQTFILDDFYVRNYKSIYRKSIVKLRIFGEIFQDFFWFFVCMTQIFEILMLWFWLLWLKFFFIGGEEKFLIFRGKNLRPPFLFGPTWGNFFHWNFVIFHDFFSV